jgi:hypothetical protein
MCPAPSTPRPDRPPADPRRLAPKIAEAVDQAWHRCPPAISGRIEVPVSVVAALSLTAPTDPGNPAMIGDYLRALPAPVFGDLLRDLWRFYVNLRPDLTPRLYPLLSWLFTDDQPDALLAAAQDTAHAALNAGLLQVTGTDARYEVDLLGMVLTELRSDAARKGHGQVYTPADVAQFIAEMLGVADGETVHEPAAGTGGMLRAAAHAMRAAGRDPTTVRWVAVDIDELAIGCLAVNVHLWNLGTNVLLGVGNSLTDDWITRAEGERRECIELAQSIRRDRLMLRLLTTIDALTDQVAAENQTATDADRDQRAGPDGTGADGPRKAAG